MTGRPKETRYTYADAMSRDSSKGRALRRELEERFEHIAGRVWNPRDPIAVALSARAISEALETTHANARDEAVQRVVSEFARVSLATPVVVAASDVFTISVSKTGSGALLGGAALQATLV
jgi:hypothetical protein